MHIIAYAGFTYLLTAVISFLLIGVIVLLNKCIGGNSDGKGIE